MTLLRQHLQSKFSGVYPEFFVDTVNRFRGEMLTANVKAFRMTSSHLLWLIHHNLVDRAEFPDGSQPLMVFGCKIEISDLTDGVELIF